MKITPLTLHARLTELEGRVDALEALTVPVREEVVYQEVIDLMKPDKLYEIHTSGFGRWEVLNPFEVRIHEGWLSKAEAADLAAEKNSAMEGSVVA